MIKKQGETEGYRKYYRARQRDIETMTEGYVDGERQRDTERERERENE